MPKLAKYLEALRLNVLQQLAYRGELVVRSMAIILFMLVFAALWSTAYGVSGRQELAGFTLA